MPIFSLFVPIPYYDLQSPMIYNCKSPEIYSCVAGVAKGVVTIYAGLEVAYLRFGGLTTLIGIFIGKCHHKSLSFWLLTGILIVNLVHFLYHIISQSFHVQQMQEAVKKNVSINGISMDVSYKMGSYIRIVGNHKVFL